jgi:glycerophosphoryl diester phosphodiesterase
MTKYFVFLLGLILFFSCSDAPKSDEIIFEVPKELKFLGHKGSGTFGENFNKDLHENSIESILNSIKKLDGSEFDLQMSADTTLWLFHDHDIYNCDSILVNFSTLKDEEIKQISFCNYHKQLAKLSELMDTLSAYNFSEKTISLDLKVLRNETAINLFVDKLQLSNKVIEILKNYENHESKIKIMIEVPHLDQYDIFKQNIQFETFLVLYKFDDLLTAQKNHKDFNVSIDLYDLKNRTPIKFSPNNQLQMWTPNRADNMIFVLNNHPDYIQSDNVDLSNFFHNFKHQKPKKTIFKTSTQSIKTSSEFFPISIIDFQKEKDNFLFQFTFDALLGDDELYLVFSANNIDNTETYWTSFNLKKDKIFEFVNVEYFKENGFETLHLYLWNINQKEFEISNWQLSKIK